MTPTPEQLAAWRALAERLESNTATPADTLSAAAAFPLLLKWTSDAWVAKIEAPLAEAREAEDMVDLIEECVEHECGTGAYDPQQLDSCALSTYAAALRLLEKHGRVKIVSDHGRRVLANWTKKEKPNAPA